MTRWHRLTRTAYDNPGSAWLVSIACRDRASRPITDERLVRRLLEVFVEGCAHLGRLLHLIVLRPDHVHLIVELVDRNLIDLVRDLNSLSTRACWECGGAGALWQTSFHDRGLRTGPDFDGAVRYVLNDPVAAGLAGEWQEYAYFAGSLIDPVNGDP